MSTHHANDRCRRALVDVDLDEDTPVVFVWGDPGTINSAAPAQIELEYVPTGVSSNNVDPGGTPGAYSIVPTRTGGTITGTTGDTSTIRIEGKIDPWE